MTSARFGHNFYALPRTSKRVDALPRASIESSVRGSASTRVRRVSSSRLNVLEIAARNQVLLFTTLDLGLIRHPVGRVFECDPATSVRTADKEIK